MVIDTNEIYIMTAMSPITGRRTKFYIIGRANALAEYEDSKANGESPDLFTTDFTPTGVIMMGEKVR